MFFDTLATADLARYPKRIAEALAWLKAQDFDTLPAGKQEIDGTAMFAQVLDLETQDKAALLPERHRLYIDVQYLHRGREIMGVAIETGNNPIATPYDEARDILLYQSAENENLLHVSAGQFAVFFPSDIHRPGIAEQAPAPIRKIVVKIAMDSFVV